MKRLFKHGLSRVIILVFMVVLIASLVGFLGYILFPTIERGTGTIEQVSTCTGIITGLSVQECTIESSAPTLLAVKVQREVGTNEVVDLVFYIESDEGLRERIDSSKIVVVSGASPPQQGATSLYRIQSPFLGRIQVSPVISNEKQTRVLCPPSVISVMCRAN